jgi:hypothetical protein
MIQQLLVGARPEAAEVPSVVPRPPEHELVETPGAGIAMVGLSPGVPRPVEPSGIPAPPADPRVCADVAESTEADPAAPDDPAEVLDPQSVIEPDGEPPPSNAEFDAAEPEQGIINGLTPLMSSSVAPSGIAGDCDDACEPRVPSGEVTPMPDVRVPWANPSPKLASQMAAAMVRARFIISQPAQGERFLHQRQLIRQETLPFNAVRT